MDQYMLRLPDGMRDRIKQAAADNNRSMNAEIISALEAAYPPPRNALAGFAEAANRASIASAISTLEKLLNDYDAMQVMRDREKDED